MKNIYTFLLLFLAATGLFAQTSSSGSSQSRQIISEVERDLSHPFRLVFYRTWANGEFGALANNSADFRYGRSGDMNAGTGISLGQTFFLNPLNVADVLNFGIDVKYFDACYVMQRGNTFVNTGDGESFFLSMGLGAVASLNIDYEVHFDFRFSIEPSIVGYYPHNINTEYIPFQQPGFGGYDLESTGEAMDFSLRKSLGFAIRYRPFTIGIELNWGNIQFDYNELVVEPDNNGNGFDINSRDTYNIDMKTSRLNLVLGFAF